MSRQVPQQTRPEGHTDSDACYTPSYAITPLLPFLSDSVKVWEPACGNYHMVQAFADHGFDVIGNDLKYGTDFFTTPVPPNTTHIITNPPYSLKYRFLAHCYKIGLPFALLVPVGTITSGKAQGMFKQYGFEIILMDKRVNYLMPNRTGTAQFSSIWLCWKFTNTPITLATINPTKQDYDGHTAESNQLRFL